MKPATKAFVRATAFGALAGGAPWTLLTVPIALSSYRDVPAGEWFLVPIFAIAPILYAAAFTLAGMLIIGLPVTLLFARLRCEVAGNFRLAGGLAGFLLPTIVFLLPAMKLGALNLLVAVPGALAGFVAASVWGDWRESVANAAADEPKEITGHDRGERWLR